MALTRTEKQPWERYFIYGDFKKVLADDETIKIVAPTTVTAVNKDGQDATADVIDDGTIYADDVEKRLYVRIKDGLEAGSIYKFTIRIETSAGNRFKVDGEIKVKET